MIHFIISSGIFGFLVIVMTCFLVPISIIILFLTKGRKAIVILALLALLPLGIGLIGTAIGYAAVKSASKTMEKPDQELIKSGQSEARNASYLGAGSTLLILIICAIGAALKKAPSEQT